VLSQVGGGCARGIEERGMCGTELVTDDSWLSGRLLLRRVLNVTGGLILGTTAILLVMPSSIMKLSLC